MNHYVTLALSNRKSPVHLHALYSPRTALRMFTPRRDHLMVCLLYLCFYHIKIHTYKKQLHNTSRVNKYTMSYVTLNPYTSMRRLFRVVTNSFPAVVEGSTLSGTLCISCSIPVCIKFKRLKLHSCQYVSSELFHIYCTDILMCVITYLILDFKRYYF
jgi:hypothetical protein